MIEFAGEAILLDIEGTTSSVTFVYDVMFPYARFASDTEPRARMPSRTDRRGTVSPRAGIQAA